MFYTVSFNFCLYLCFCTIHFDIVLYNINDFKKYFILDVVFCEIYCFVIGCHNPVVVALRCFVLHCDRKCCTSALTVCRYMAV